MLKPCLFLALVFSLYSGWILGADAASSFIKEASSITFPIHRTYDYIIVGGGTAGCALAASLSQHFKVLVLERGGSPYGNPNITRIENVEVNFANPGENTPNQAFVSEDGVSNIRANVLGGGSSINGAVYNRADPEFLRESKLDPDLIEASYAWVERVVASRPENYSALQEAVRRSLVEVGVRPEYGFTYEYVVGTKTSGITFDKHGRRHPSSDLLLRYANPRNIVVLLHATAQKIALEGSSKRVRGVSFTDSLGRSHTALLSSKSGSEVVLSAGAVGSPQLLMLSGIGPKSHLESLGIDVVLDSPGVGRGMADNPSSVIPVLSPIPLGAPVQQVIGVSQSGFSVGAFIGSTNLGFIFKEINGPLSSGELQLKSTNASETPRVRFNYFESSVDLQRCIAGVNVLEEMLLSESMAPVRFSNQSLPSGGTFSSPHRRNSTLVAAGVINQTISDFCKQNISTNYHYHGGCRRGEVVDEEFRVVGASGLRVVDGSTFSATPGTNPQATVMMLGRYVGVKILESRKNRVH